MNAELLSIKSIAMPDHNEDCLTCSLYLSPITGLNLAVVDL